MTNSRKIAFRFYLLFGLIGLLTCQVSNLHGQQATSLRLNDHWKFLKSDLGGIWEAVRPVKAGDPESVPLWEEVSLPHCFNAMDAVDPDLNYYQGPGWYTNRIRMENPFPGGRTLLHFEGAGQKSEVYLYTTKVGSHVGGYNEWWVDLTDALAEFRKNNKAMEQFKGLIPIAIRCDNSRDLEMIPSDLSDFNLYGGIYRYLNLVYLPAVSLENLQLNVSVDPKGSEGKLEMDINFRKFTSLDKTQLRIEIKDPTGKLLTS